MQRITQIIILCLLTACGQKQQTLSQEELKAYVLNPENGLSKTITKEGVKLFMQYKPKDLIIRQNLNTNNKTEIDSLRKALAGYEYFVLGLSKNEREIEGAYAGNAAKYASVVQYLSSGISENIHLISNKDTVDIYETLYVPGYGSSGATSVLLIFKEGYTKEDDEIKIVLDDYAFGTGKTEFAFDVNVLTHAPNLDVLTTY
jgi:hypothetical protein